MTTKLVTVILFGVLCTSGTLAQTNDGAPSACNAQFAQLLVQQQVMEAKSVTEPVKRIKILTRSADFLWSLDEPTARSYFSEAWKIADDRFKEKGFESNRSGDKGSQIMVLLPDQRSEVLKAIGKRDKEWARKLSEQMLADYEKNARDRKPGFDETRELTDLLFFAVGHAKSDPEFSRQLIRRVMKYPLFSSWFSAMFGLAQNRPLGDAVYLEALNHYRNETPRKLLYLSAYPFGNPRIFGIDRNMMSQVQQDVQLNEALARRFLEVFFSRIAAFAASEADINRPVEANSRPESVYMVTALSDIEPYIMERFPDLLGRFGEARAQASALLSEDARKSMEDGEKQNSRFGHSFEERLKAIEEADSTGKLTDYMIANMVFRENRSDEEFEKIRPWLEKMKEEKPRNETINFYWFKRAKLAVDEKRFEDAEKYAAKIPELEHRASLLFEIAGIQAKNESNAAALFETLNRVAKLARSAENSVAKAQVLLGLSNMYEKVNHAVAMDELTEAIRVTNALKEPDIFRTHVSRQIVGKGYAFHASFVTPGFDLEKTFDELSRKDFEISLGQAKALDDRYFRTLAVIAVANNCVKNSKPAVKQRARAN